MGNQEVQGFNLSTEKEEHERKGNPNCCRGPEQTEAPGYYWKW